MRHKETSAAVQVHNTWSSQRSFFWSCEYF